jgi:hypothetical protein
MNEKVEKIVELGIDIDNIDDDIFEELGVDVISLVESPAIEVDFLAFADETEVELRANPDCPDGYEHKMPDGTWMCGKTHGYDEEELKKKKKKKSNYATEEEQEAILAFAREAGQTIMAEDIVVDLSSSEFDTVTDVLRGISALDILNRLPVKKDEPALTRYRYQGPPAERKFCRAMMRLNKLYTREEITRMVNINRDFGHDGAPYSKWSYKGGPNCKHFWEEVAVFKGSNNQNIIIVKGPASGNAGVDPYSMPKHGYYSAQFALDEDKRIATGPIMVPNKMILRRDEAGNPFYVYFTRKTIRKMAEKFLANSNHNNTDVEHDGQIKTENTLLETWISEDMVKDKSSTYGFALPPGTWYASYRINNDEDWQKIKAGELKGFSLAGNFLERIKPQPQLSEDDKRLNDIKNILKDVQ